MYIYIILLSLYLLVIFDEGGCPVYKLMTTCGPLCNIGSQCDFAAEQTIEFTQLSLLGRNSIGIFALFFVLYQRD